MRTYFEPDFVKPWNFIDFYKYYKDERRMKLGSPREFDTVTLSQVGHMQRVIDYARFYSQPKGGSIFDRFARDICKKARREGAGSYSESFSNKYGMISVAAAFRTSTVKGTAQMNVVDKGEFLVISADVDYTFYDRYTDPYDFLDHSNDTEDEIYDDGVPYDIVGAWQARLEAIIKKDNASSRYPDDAFG